MSQSTIKIGISACLVGQEVRFDKSHKKSHFCVEQLGQFVEYQAFCPEVAIGLPVPRPTIRLVKKDEVIHLSRPDGSGDVTEKMTEYASNVAQKLSGLSGFVFTAKSPSCGMERVKLYNEKGDPLPATATGLFAQQVMQANPLLPCEENGRLNDMPLRENFVLRVFAYHDWQQQQSELTMHKLIQFHSRYKYLVMSHDYTSYKKLGQLLANKQQLPLEQIAGQYIRGLMAALKKLASKKSHGNTLQHIQGYFSKYLNADERAELTQQIDDFRTGLKPLIAPLTLLKHYLLKYPDEYIAQQVYLAPYPESLGLRYGL